MTCSVVELNQNRFSECQNISARVDVVKDVRGVRVRVGQATFTIRHAMTLSSGSTSWRETFQVSKAVITGQATGVSVRVAVRAGNGTTATVSFPQGHTLDRAASGTVTYRTTPIPKRKINAKTQTTYTYTFTSPGRTIGSFSYRSAAYRCDNYYGTSGCAMTEAPTAVSMIGLPRIDEGIRSLRARGGRYGNPNGGLALHWMINDGQKNKNRAAVCNLAVPPAMRTAGRTTCDEYPFASTYEGGTTLPANQRAITWVNRSENDAQGARITNWRRAFHVMDHDPFYVIA
ncbi:NucA/NucB deoxyribonuclease domain-containing protein [Frankia sp. AiPa1]|uniref:NucA/NucB deoxyribonuclease domain-containing protein n=1 Tax=Frankia sp. AiPa1 TaxID=573492 RepID=UPI00202B9161|nr:hypothetical protein [Frankia sp. AiPa1]MCL9759256.1 hypothetical protein [Frankia sp. AiPa1]